MVCQGEVNKEKCNSIYETTAMIFIGFTKSCRFLIATSFVQDQVRAEATAMSLISHPNVLRAYCSFVAKNSLWVVMPYMAGGSCVHIMKAAFPDGFEEPVIATILKETLKALNYLHQHGHIHRDVKVSCV